MKVKYLVIQITTIIKYVRQLHSVTVLKQFGFILLKMSRKTKLLILLKNTWFHIMLFLKKKIAFI